MKKFICGFMVLLLATIISVSANAAPGDTLVQVDFLISGASNDQCSILKVAPNGTLSEFASFEDITDLTGEPNCDFDDVGMAIADNGDVYFSEDESKTIIKATPDGVLSTFVTTAQIMAVTLAGDVDLDHAMEIGPDGDLYFIDEFSDTLLKATIPGSVVSLVLSNAQIQAVVGPDQVDIDAGMAFDCDGNLYFVNNPSGQQPPQLDSILKFTPLGNLSIFVDGQEIIDGTTFASDIDSGVAFFDSLFIQDAGTCDCVIEVTLDGGVSVFVSEGQITTVTLNGGADPDGGIAVNQSREVIFGDDGSNPEDPNVLKSSPRGTSLSLFVSTQQLEDFYQSVDFDQINLKGSIAIEGVDPCPADIPTLSEWGLIAMAGILGIVGFMVIRRRMVKA